MNADRSDSQRSCAKAQSYKQLGEEEALAVRAQGDGESPIAAPRIRNSLEEMVPEVGVEPT